MENPHYLKAVPLAENVYWVGAVDWNVTDFHGYKTSRGTTYNAFLIIDEKITLIDTVKAPFLDQLISRISSVIDPERIDYIISNHAEPDHSGSLAAIADMVRPEKIFASVAGKKALHEHYRLPMEIEAVRTGDRITVGSDSITFIETKMLHWPDSMFSFLEHSKILFSQDAFGMHLAGAALFADEYDRETLRQEAGKYYANILLLYSEKIRQLLEKMPGFNLDIKIIAPDHGPLWRRPEDIAMIMEWYRLWAEQPLNARALVVYDTMWNATEKMAMSVADGLRDHGVEPRVVRISARDRSLAATELLDCGAVLVGSPTINNNIFPSMADVLTYLRGLRPHRRIGAAFGSYGWSGEAIAQLEEYLKSMGVEIVAESVKHKYMPDSEALKNCYQLGAAVAEQLLARIRSRTENM